MQTKAYRDELETHVCSERFYCPRAFPSGTGRWETGRGLTRPSDLAVHTVGRVAHRLKAGSEMGSSTGHRKIHAVMAHYSRTKAFSHSDRNARRFIWSR